MKKQKRKEKEKERKRKKKKDIRSNFANADMNQQGRRKRVGRLDGSGRAQHPDSIFLLFSERKVIKISHF
jgi:hypothetical protein